jgi:mannosyltransferase
VSTVREARPVAPVEDHGAPRRFSPWIVAGAGVILAVGVVLRFVTRSDLWLDEALTVNIAALPVGDIPDALRQDGAPPLYYVLLHYWMELFGTGDTAVRALSGLFAVATLPALYFVGRRVAGRHADEHRRTFVAWTAVLLMATSPFAIRYATEARMYSLEMLLVTFGLLVLYRALEQPTLVRLALVALLTGLLLYTNYWSNYLVAVVAAGLIVHAWRSAGVTRRAALGCLVAIAAGCVTFIPWLDTFFYQARNTATPWGEPVLPPAAFDASLVEFGGGNHWESVVVRLPLALLFVLAIVGVALDRWRIEVDLHTRPGVRLVALCTISALGLGATAAWLAPEGTFQARYAAVVFPLFVLTVAFGFLCLADRRFAIGLLAGIAVLGLVAATQRNALEDRTQAGEVAESIRADARPGDVVVYCPDQLGPAVSRLLEGEDLDQLTYPDAASPEFVDWVDYVDRNRGGDPNAVASAALERVAPGGSIWLVAGTHYRGVEGKCEELQIALQAQRPNAEVRVAPNDDIYEFEGLTRFAPE